MKNENEKPPVGKSWKQLYYIVIGELILLIGLFSWFSNAFN
ncbi:MULTISPECIES: hypothetical protein [Flammeovirga]|nr:MULTISPECIES: hypothetical protein [Flammeovirga]MBB6460549.1 hypothetical protein [Flammeovirga kamogawensis]